MNKASLLFVVLLVAGCGGEPPNFHPCPNGTMVWSIDDKVAKENIPNWQPVMCKDEQEKLQKQIEETTTETSAIKGK